MDKDDIEETYSFDCENCAFRRFMEMYGFYANCDTCWVDCTKEVQANIDATFSMILENTYVNESGMILYTGNVIDRGGLPPS